MKRVRIRMWWCQNCKNMFLYVFHSGRIKQYCTNICRKRLQWIRHINRDKEGYNKYHRERMRMYRNKGFDLNLMKEVQVDNTLQLSERSFGFIKGQEELCLVPRNGNRKDDNIA